MRATVDLGGQPPAPPLGIQVTSPPLGIMSDCLPIRLRKSGLPAKLRKVDFGECLGSTGDVVQYGTKDFNMLMASYVIEHSQQVFRPSQSLLHSGGQNVARPVHVGRPQRGVDQRTGNAGARRLPDRVNIARTIPPRFVDANAIRLEGPGPFRDDDMNLRRRVSREPGSLGGCQSRKDSVHTRIEYGTPPTLDLCEGPSVEHDRASADPLPALRAYFTPQAVAGQAPLP